MYIFPFDHYTHPTRFVSEVGSLGFLAKHNFDFNKWVYEGVGYVKQNKMDEYELLRDIGNH